MACSLNASYMVCSVTAFYWPTHKTLCSSKGCCTCSLFYPMLNTSCYRLTLPMVTLVPSNPESQAVTVQTVWSVWVKWNELWYKKYMNTLLSKEMLFWPCMLRGSGAIQVTGDVTHASLIPWDSSQGLILSWSWVPPFELHF